MAWHESVLWRVGCKSRAVHCCLPAARRRRRRSGLREEDESGAPNLSGSQHMAAVSEVSRCLGGMQARNVCSCCCCRYCRARFTFSTADPTHSLTPSLNMCRRGTQQPTRTPLELVYSYSQPPFFFKSLKRELGLHNSHLLPKLNSFCGKSSMTLSHLSHIWGETTNT